jgi:CheY-like chemotaxis protein
MKKILIAEDDLTSRTIIVRSVEAAGHIAFCCSNGKRAWETLCDNTDFSLLITDISMPDMDGRELIARVRSAGAPIQQMPIIIVSGVVGPAEIASLIEEGASRFLPKPLNVSYLADYMKALLERRTPISETSAHAQA